MRDTAEQDTKKGDANVELYHLECRKLVIDIGVLEAELKFKKYLFKEYAKHLTITQLKKII